MAEIVTMGEMLCEIMRPEEGIPLNRADIFKGPFPSGAPAIFIDTAARLGHSTAIISGVGEDDFGECILSRLKGDGVDCSHVIRCINGSTGVAFVTYFKDGSRRFLYHFSNTPATAAKMPDINTLKGTKYFHIMGCSLMADKNFANEIVKTMRALKKEGVQVTFDPNIRPELLGDREINGLIQEVIRNCTIFLPGLSELLLLTDVKSEDGAVKKLFNDTKIEIIVVKNGSKGCHIYTKDQKYEMGVYPAAVVDATGAGDSFDAAFLCALLSGKDVEEAGKYASAAAAINTEAFGPMEGRISNAAIEQKMQKGMA